MSIQDRAREFVDQHVKTLPIAVRLSGITGAEKKEAASLCADFAEIAVREFVEMLDVGSYAKTRERFREMFGKSLDG